MKEEMEKANKRFIAPISLIYDTSILPTDQKGDGEESLPKLVLCEFSEDNFPNKFLENRLYRIAVLKFLPLEEDSVYGLITEKFGKIAQILTGKALSSQEISWEGTPKYQFFVNSYQIS